MLDLAKRPPGSNRRQADEVSREVRRLVGGEAALLEPAGRDSGVDGRSSRLVIVDPRKGDLCLSDAHVRGLQYAASASSGAIL
jgi:hypothetical protein